MPIYEYECEACGHYLEALQKLSDAPLTHCPHCGQPGLRKLISAPTFRLKGGGWYETDFKTGKRRYVADGDGQPAAGAKSDGAGNQSAEAAQKKPESAPAKAPSQTGAGKPSKATQVE